MIKEIPGQSGGSIAIPPQRRPWSLRRTCSFQNSFPGGPGTDLLVRALGRDIWTSAHYNDVAVLSDARLDVTIDSNRSVTRAVDRTGHLDLSFLHKLKVGREVRNAKAVELGQDVAHATLPHRLLEELSAVAFLSPGAFLAWSGDQESYRRDFAMGPRLDRPVEGLCISYQRGSVAMTDDGRSNMDVIRQPNGQLAARTNDGWAFHDLVPGSGPELTRLRRQDLWWDEGQLHVDFAFQDSAARSGEPLLRKIYHEYRIAAQIDPEGMRLAKLHLTAGSLPFPTCPSADQGALSLLGESVIDFDHLVTTKLAGIAGCTHLNSALRTLQDVPALAKLAHDQARSPN